MSDCGCLGTFVCAAHAVASDAAVTRRRGFAVIDPATHKSRSAAGGSAERRQRRGFAAMQPGAQRALASAGGIASHAQGVGHVWDRAAASAAGKKGGRASADRRKRIALEATDAGVSLPPKPRDYK